MKPVIFGLGLLALWATAASAQEPLLVSMGTVQVGDQLRATYLPDPSNTDREGTLTGEYAGQGPNALRLSASPGGEQVHEVDLDAILRLERSRPRTVGEGAGRGAIWGGVAGHCSGWAPAPPARAMASAKAFWSARRSSGEWARGPVPRSVWRHAERHGRKSPCPRRAEPLPVGQGEGGADGATRERPLSPTAVL